MDRLKKIEHASDSQKFTTVVDWCLGNTCNYECSYCPPNLHDGSFEWPNLDILVNFSERVISHYNSIGQSLFFHFSGGEPTIYKDLTYFLRYLKTHNARTGLVSNGSRSLNWWKEVVPYLDAIVLTYHIESVRPEKFMSVANLLSNSIKTHINVTMLPERFDECFQAAQSVRSNCPAVSITLKPLLMEFGDAMFPYSKDQLHRIQQFSLQSTPSAGPISNSRGQMLSSYSDGETSFHHATYFITSRLNHWTDWICNAGIESLAINFKGEVFRAVCRQGGSLGNIYDTSLIFPSSPIRCQKNACTCLSDIMITKWAVED